MVRYFSIEILLWRLRSGIVMVDNHTIANKTGMVSPEGLSQGFWYGAVPVSVNCVSVFQDVHQKRLHVASALPVDCVTLQFVFPVEAKGFPIYG